jgi:hypothetical protein
VLSFVLFAGFAAPIIGGGPDVTDTAIVDVELAGGQCSGVVVAPRVVVTAAHCVAPGDGSIVDFGVAIDRVWIDRYYTGDVDHDLAALHVVSDLPVTPLVFAPATLGPVTLVGFGATVPLGPRGVRHAVAADLTDVAGRHLLVGGTGATTCTGDSGGAALDASGRIVGIITAGDESCTGPSLLVRPDSEPQLAEVIAAWTTGCDAPCDPCAFEGTCGIACPRVDLDCPLGRGAGESCLAATDCESRSCVSVIEGAAFGAICSLACETAADCPAPLDSCSAGACVYATTPGIAGASCTTDDQCRSALCDPDARACTSPCGAGDACPTGLTCAPVRDTRACTFATGCSAGGGGASWLVVAIALVISRRRPLKSAARRGT